MAGRAAARRHGRVTQYTGLLQSLFILRPHILLIDTEKVQVVPREDAAVVAVAERWLHAVIANGLKAEYAHVSLTGLQYFLPGAVALHFGRRAAHPQQLERQTKALAVVKQHLEYFGSAVQHDVGWLRGGGLQACHNLYQYAFDAAGVGVMHILGHPVVAQDFFGHFNHDVVGFEQTVLQIVLKTV